MSASTAVHSNAFNYADYIDTGVDSRTGQYTVSIRLPALKGNDLQGPDFDLALFYSPLNGDDSGFGKGWNLQLTQVRNNVVTLSSGESYRITGTSSSTGRLEMREQKLRRFDLYPEPAGPDGAERYRVEHSSGLVEVLKTMGSGAGQVALPVELHSPLGHVLYLDYTPFQNGHMLLSEVWDEYETLLTLQRAGSRVEILCYPFGGGGGEPLARYGMTLSGSDYRVSEIILPTANQARWRFAYREVRGHLCLSEMRTPFGGLERIFHDDAGHEFPSSANRANLPRVTRHETLPGFGQPASVVRYEYPGTRNFIGGGSTIPWSDEGLDNLYQVEKGYAYQTVEHHEQKGMAVRTIMRTFNRFHLLTVQDTVKGDKRLQAINVYGEVDGSFDQQPPYFQLPHQETQRWSWVSDASRQREETQLTTYDTHGNVLTRILPNKVLETSVWYQAAEEGDPHGFVRNLKSREIKPAATGAGSAPTLIQQYRYREMAPLGSYLKKAWRLVEVETLSDPGADPDEFHEKIASVYFDAPAEPMSYGRVQQRTLSYPSQELGKTLDTTTEYAYSLPKDTRALQTLETLVGFDGETKTITLQHGLETGEPLLNRDDNDVEIRYEYDALRRVTREIVAPGKPIEANRRYKYFLCAYDNEQAQQWTYDVKQVETHTLFDGLRRPVFEEREDHDSATFAGASRPIYRAQYDELGQLTEETEIDWLGDRLLELTSTYDYDDWGQQYSVTLPYGVTEVEEVDQVASKDGPVHRTWREVAGARCSGITETWQNLFEKPWRIERFKLDGETVVSLQINEYDGLGRLSAEKRGSGTGQRIDEYRYDVFDRILQHDLPDRVNKVYRAYALHSRNDLPESIKVGNSETSALLLGLQEFDGLERRISATTGGRRQEFKYAPGERQPRWVKAADGELIEYQYDPALGEDPVRRVLARNTARFDYDPKNARLLHCEEAGEGEASHYLMDRDYFLGNGEVRHEKRTVDGEAFTMVYDYSYRSRLLGYLDVLNQMQSYEYDDFGRLVKTVLSAPVAANSRYRMRRKPTAQLVLLTSTFEYDEQGRMASYSTQDVVAGQALITRLDYDEFDREVLRTFDFGDTLQTLEQDYDEFDCLNYRILKQRAMGADPSDAELLRHETYQYDRRGRLQLYTCEGPEAPVDPSGQVIARQTFGFDAVDNIISVITQSPGGAPQRTRYEFTNTDDPAQLTRILPPAPQPPVELEYDLNGNLTRDDQGRVLTYDSLNRLLRVDTPEGEHCLYHYDPENILSGTSPA
ncbi:RHS repeat domain-containing protein [Pseudomonas sp. NPDC089422]|uniref:RHS repeat domain-containing protein n=1 Tax=Pseudomonas sp. NPDC089422 TaxID=3364466 RepID=UPI00380E76CD